MKNTDWRGRRCLACGDGFDLTEGRIGEAKQNRFLLTHCVCCAYELNTGTLPNLGSAFSKGCGGGRRVVRDTKTH